MQQSRRVGRGIVRIRANAQQQWRTLAGDDNAIFAFPDHRDGIGAGELPGGDADRVEKIGYGLECLFNQMRDGLGVSFGFVDMALGNQSLTNLGEVLDNAVMDDRQPARNMRMRIAFGGGTVRRPARVRDALHRAQTVGLRRQFGHAAQTAQPMQTRIQHRKPRRVIAPVFEFAQTLDQYRNNVAIGNCRDDPAHGQFFSNV